MATFDLTVGGNAAVPFSMPNAVIREVTVDFAATNYSSADILQLIDVPAKTWVPIVQYDVETAEGGTLTFDLGDGADPNGFINNANGNSVASGVNTLALVEAAPNTVDGYSNGKYYAAADTIDMVIDNDADAAKITVRAVLVPLA